MKTDADTMQTIINDIIRTQNLCGRSFTYGAALRIAMENQWLYDDLDDVVEGMLRDIYGEVLGVMEEAGLRTDLEALSHILDLAVLDEIARTIIEENEEE